MPYQSSDDNKETNKMTKPNNLMELAKKGGYISVVLLALIVTIKDLVINNFDDLKQNYCKLFEDGIKTGASINKAQS
jgi:hypothetical protein